MNIPETLTEEQPGDAPEFLIVVDRLLIANVEKYEPHEVVIVRIDNWFDHRWLNYSGKAVVHFEFSFPNRIDAALDSQWREKVTVPPFHPNRVQRSQYFYTGSSTNPAIEKATHRWRTSNSNIHNRIADLTKNGLFVWYSSNTEVNQRGSIMLYRVQQGEVHTWYASLENKNGWKITRTKGIATEALNELLSAQQH